MAAIWSRVRKRRGGARNSGNKLDLGFRVADGEVTRHHVMLSNIRRAMHIAALGKTGVGKSSLLKYFASQDIESDRGFLLFDLHGDTTPFLLRTISTRERRLHRHLSDKLVVVAPADPELSVGLNPLEQATPEFVRVTEFAEVLKHRWSLDHFGARTDELLRNSLYVLSANGFTLLELAPLLTHDGFRTACLKQLENPEIRQYFDMRFNRASEPMRTAMREPILNKVSAFTADPHFRHIVGQKHSTFSLVEAMDEGHWVIVDLEKGRLGEQSLVLGSLVLTVLKNALFSRRNRSLFTVYCDEIQNLVTYGSGIETILSEARKFGVAVVSANQFLDQYSAEIRAAIAAVGTHVYFQLSSIDANRIASALDGGRSVVERLKDLPTRHAIVKTGVDRWTEVRVPNVPDPQIDYTDLLNRSRYSRGRVRAFIEREIAQRHAQLQRQTDAVLDGWE